MSHEPPWILRRLLAWILPAGRVQDGLLGDLDELYADRVRRSRASANLWYARQVVSATMHYVAQRVWRRGVGERAGLTSELGRDVWYAFRMLRRRPGFTALIVLTLALGIGANTVIFSVIDAVLLQPLPYADPDRLVHVIQYRRGDDDVTRGAFSREDFADLTLASPAFESVAAYALGVHVLTGGEPQELDAAYVSAGFFRTMGIEPALGRTPGVTENVPGADQVAVLSDAIWRSRFGSDVGVIGKTMILDGAPFVITGVMPASFDFPSPDASIWIPLSRIGCDNIPCGRNQRFMQVVARVAPGTTVAMASSATNALLERLEATYPETNEGWSVARVVPLRESVVGDVRPALLILFGAVALVLLIACVNVANLLLARSTTRGREFAIRAALGASRWRVARQLLTESVVLALAGGAVGFALAYRGVDAVVALSGGSIPRWYEIRPDLRVAAFAFALSVLTGVLFGLLPSMAAARADVHDSLNAGGRSGADGGWRQRKRGFLIALEVAMAVVLLTGSGLLIRTFWNLTRVDTGFRAENVLSLSLSMSGDVMSGAARNAYRREIIERVANLPGVIAAGGSKDVPLHGTSEYYKVTLPATSSETYPQTHIVTGNYFRALGVSLLEGRLFTNADETDRAQVVIVNQAMARQFWPGSSPVGESVLMFDEVVRVVGVVGDVRHGGIVQSPTPAIYLLPHFGGRRSMNLYVRTTTDPLHIVDAIRTTIWDVNPDQPISRIATMEDVVTSTIQAPRFLTVLLGGFAGLAVVLAALGVYGVTAYHVSRRSYEVGVRMALGGRAGDVLRLIMRQGLAPVFAGLVIGLIAARGLTRLLSNLLFGVEATDPLVFAAVALFLVTIAFLAVYVPARRAARVDPMVALRAQ